MSRLVTAILFSSILSLVSVKQVLSQRLAQSRLLLDAPGSPIAVKILNGPIQMTGTLFLTSGEWLTSGERHGDPIDLARSEIRLSGNLKDFRLDPIGNLTIGSLNINSLSAALPHKAGMFQSSQIRPGPDGTAILEGQISIDGKRYPVSVPVRITREAKSVVMNVRHSGTVDQWPNVIPLPVVPGSTVGTVEAKLRFQAPKK